jgi:SAM-dependent methyltransferase
MKLLAAVRGKTRLVWEEPPPISETTADCVLQLSGIDPREDNTGLRVLDFGCGRGRYLEVYGRCVLKSNLFGCDVDEDAIEVTRKLGFDCILLEAGVAKLPYECGSFDVVFSSNVVEHIPRAVYLKYLEEIQRVLRPDGRFVLGAPNYPIKRLYDMFTAMKSENPSYYLFDDPTHVNRLSCRRLESDLRPWFREVHLWASRLFLDGKIAWLRRAETRHRLRALGYKLSGYCVK